MAAAPQIGEETKVTLDLKTIGMIVGFVLTSDEKQLIDINGNKVQDLSESQIYRFTNDLQHPARFLIVKDIFRFSLIF